MIAKKVTRYYAECGRGYCNKSACEQHERVCKCWKNPKHRTCLTCAKYSKHTEVDEGQGYYNAYTVNDCNHVSIDESILTPCHENAPDIYKNCPYWVLKQKK